LHRWVNVAKGFDEGIQEAYAKKSAAAPENAAGDQDGAPGTKRPAVAPWDRLTYTNALPVIAMHSELTPAPSPLSVVLPHGACA